jgi:biotin synthase-like enzyme
LEETTNKGNTELEKAIFSHADAVTNKFFGQSVYYRGIVEFSNVCANDCGYCGIRKHMHVSISNKLVVAAVQQQCRRRGSSNSNSRNVGVDWR